MTPEQRTLLRQAQESLVAAKLLDTAGYHGFAASRAYYTMFYVAQAFLLGKGLSFSRHSGVIAAFGQHFAKTGLVPPLFHRYLIRGLEVRHAGDYDSEKIVTPEESKEQLDRAEQFLKLAEQLIGPLSGEA